MNSTNGTIQMQEDDGEDEVTSGMGILKQPSFHVVKRSSLKLLEEIKKFNEIKKEMVDENTFAMENNMDSVFWCWNCQHSDCDRH